MESSGAFAGSLLGILLLLILYGFIFVATFLSALGIYRAGTGYYQKIKNDTRATLYNKTFDAYREYNDMIFDYITLINEDNNFNINKPVYKEAQQKLRYASGAPLLLANNNVSSQIKSFIDYSLAASNNQETYQNMDEAKKEFLAQLVNLQKAIQNHLNEIKPLIIW